jgi:hypothetical protein
MALPGVVEIGSENPLKVETRVRTPLGVQQRPRSDALSSLNGESAQPVVPRTNATRQIRVVSTDASLGDAAPTGTGGREAVEVRVPSRIYASWHACCGSAPTQSNSVGFRIAQVFDQPPARSLHEPFDGCG